MNRPEKTRPGAHTPHPDPPDLRSVDPTACFGKFVRVDRLGAGGMGEVWRAWDTDLRRWVALKFTKGGEADEIERFTREARSAGGFAHPNIAAIYEVGSDAGRPYIAMQYVDGQTLKSFPRSDPRLLVRVVRDAARAVAAAHGHGIVHRDIKPENIMVTPQHHVYVMDFGLAREVDSEKSGGGVVGTPAYMAPEQARGEAVDARADVYSLGMTLYELVTGRKPFTGSNIYEVLSKVQEEDPPPPRSVRPGIEPDLETVVLKAIEKSPGRRYESAAALADDLDRWLEGEPILANPPGMAYRWKRKLAKHKAVTLIVAATAVTVIGAAIFILPQLRRHEMALTEAQRGLVDNMVQRSEACLDAAIALRRDGNTAGMARFAESLVDVCRQVVDKVPASAEPHYFLGRMYRTQLRFDEALAEQGLALAGDPTHEGARKERGILHFWKWTREPGNPEWKAKARKDLAGLKHPTARAIVMALDGDDGALQGIASSEEEIWTYLGDLLGRTRSAEAAAWFERGMARDKGFTPHVASRDRYR